MCELWGAEPELEPEAEPLAGNQVAEDEGELAPGAAKSSREESRGRASVRG